LRKELAESNTVTKIYESLGDLKTNNSGEDTITSTISGDASSQARWRPDPPENTPETVILPKAIDTPRHGNLCYQSLSSHDSSSVVTQPHGSGPVTMSIASNSSVFRASDHSRLRPDSADNIATFDSTSSSEEWSKDSMPPASFNPRKEIRETIKYHHKLGQLLSKLALDPAMSCMEVKQVTFALSDSTNNHVNTHPNSEETKEVTKSHRVRWVTSFESANSCDSVIEPVSSLESTYSNNLVSNFEDITRVPSTESGFSTSQCSSQSNRSQKVEQHLSFLETHMTLLGSSDAGTQKRVWPAASPTNDFDADWVSSMPEKNCISDSNTSSKDSFFPVKGDLRSPLPTCTSTPNERDGARDNVSSRELSPPRTKVLALASKFSPATPLLTIPERSESSDWPTSSPSTWPTPSSFLGDIEIDVESTESDEEEYLTAKLSDDKSSHEMEVAEINSCHEYVEDLHQWRSRKVELRNNEEMDKSGAVPPLLQPNAPIVNETLSNPNMNIEIIIKDLLEKSLVSMEARILKNLNVHLNKESIQQRLAMEELIREKSASMEASILKKLTAHIDTATAQQQNAIEDMIEDKVSKAIAGANLEMRLAVHDVKTETERISKMVFHDRSKTPPRDRSLPRKDQSMNQANSISLVIDGRSSRRLSKAGKNKSWIKDNVVEEKVSQKSLEDSFTETMKVIDDFVIDCDDIVSDFDKIASRMQDSVASDSSPMSMSSNVVGEGFIDEMETEVQDIINAGQLILSSKLEKITKMKNSTTSVTANSSTLPTSEKKTHVIGDVIRAYSDTAVSVNTASSTSSTSGKTPHVVKKVIRANGDNSWIKSRVSSQEDSAPNTESLSTSTLADTSLQQSVIATSTPPSVLVKEAKISQQRAIVAPRDNSWIKSKVSSKEESAPNTESLSTSTMADTSLEKSVIATSTPPSVLLKEAKISQQRTIVAPRDNSWIKSKVSSKEESATHTESLSAPIMAETSLEQAVIAASTSPSESVLVADAKISQQRVIVATRDNSWIKSRVSSQEDSAPNTESLTAPIMAETSLEQSVIAVSTSPSVSVEEATISQRVIEAPRGRLGIVVANTILNDRVGPAVHTVREGSPLEGLMHVNDVIVAINDVDTSKYTVGQLTKLMAATSDQERRITVQSTTVHH
jgi:hypothetical protein